ncbi:BrnA antitoxin family protein [Lamprobacter modestohalophilus]|uniref:BrnA antitoxin family protein n=1 Tax=Lamprobacter modestohalophilus TaxID=1064514 RepID=UPI002ADEFB9F|nr:BrnA antitoxin family protein [Lamprobacter modestohalophilus]MEA1050500.1 BrnA antitoxin family protein [Lamprobacter modestohalophilus]
MKHKPLPEGFSVSPEQLQAMIDAAPEQVDDPDCPYDPNDPQAVEAYWENAVFTPGGGPEVVQAAMAERRRLRGAQKAPTKIPTTIRLDPDVLAGLRATGKGWQTRANAALRDWLQHRERS